MLSKRKQREAQREKDAREAEIEALMQSIKNQDALIDRLVRANHALQDACETASHALFRAAPAVKKGGNKAAAEVMDGASEALDQGLRKFEEIISETQERKSFAETLAEALGGTITFSCEIKPDGAAVNQGA